MRIEFAAIKSRGAVARYVARYGGGEFPQWKATAEKLRALPPEQHTPGIIAAIIGNQGWTHLSCRECGNYVDVAITLGENSDGVTVCLPCLKSAAAALAAAQSAMAALQVAAPTGDA